MRLTPLLPLATLLASITCPARAQNPLRHWTDAIQVRYADSLPQLVYTLTVDTADLSSFRVELHIRHARDTIRLGMVAHPEYDGRYWRYVEGFSADGPRGATVAREDSAVWRVVAPGGESLIRYRLHLPPATGRMRAAWRPFLTSTGGLMGGPPTFMYVLGATLAPAHVILDLPAGWMVATGLTPTADPGIFFAPSAFVLVDSPILAGRLRGWTYVEDGVPHRVAYWPAPDATPFDTTALVNGLAGITHQAALLFGRLPYRDYTFLLQDASFGALEHLNSVTLGAPSAGLARGLAEFSSETAHEYFHAWNMMRLRPAEYGDVDYRTPPRARELWWSEGITMYYADLLKRRAGLPVFQPTRLAHLEALLGRYYASPGSRRFSPESVSVVTFGGGPGALGDYTASTHLQGELIATLLEFQIRSATGGRHSLADVLRLLFRRYSGTKGFTSADVQQAVAQVCGCRAEATRFFQRYVRGATPLDFNAYLRLAGLRDRVDWVPAADSTGRPLPDTRVFAVDAPSGPPILILSDPRGAWGRAGLHTKDRILSLNGDSVATGAGFRQARDSLGIGDSVQVGISRAGVTRTVRFVMTGYQRPVAHVEELPGATAAERRIREAWLAREY